MKEIKSRPPYVIVRWNRFTESWDFLLKNGTFSPTPTDETIKTWKHVRYADKISLNHFGAIVQYMPPIESN